MDGFQDYEELKIAGHDPAFVFNTAKADGVDDITMIRLLRQVFGLSLAEAKGVMVTAKGKGETLSEHQGKVAESVAKILDETALSDKGRSE